MSKRVTITIDVDENADLYISDILCYLRGFLAGKGESEDDCLLHPGLETLRNINLELKSQLSKRERS